MSDIEANIRFYIEKYQTTILGNDIIDDNIRIEGVWIRSNVYTHPILNENGSWNVLYFYHDNTVKINKCHSHNTPTLQQIKYIIDNDTGVIGIWEGNLQYITTECAFALEKLNLINPIDLSTTLPRSWSLKSLLSSDPITIEEFKQGTCFSLAHAEWLIAEEKRLSALLCILRRNCEIKAYSTPITGNYTTHVKELITNDIECDSKLTLAQYKLNEIHSKYNKDKKHNEDIIQFNNSNELVKNKNIHYFKTSEFITINIHKMTFCNCILYFVGFFLCAGLNNVNKIFNIK